MPVIVGICMPIRFNFRILLLGRHIICLYFRIICPEIKAGTCAVSFTTDKGYSIAYNCNKGHAKCDLGLGEKYTSQWYSLRIHKEFPVLMLDIHPKVKYNELEQLYDYNKRVIRAQADIWFPVFVLQCIRKTNRRRYPIRCQEKIRSSCPSSNG